MSSSPPVVAAIVNYNRAGLTLSTLASLLQHTPTGTIAPVVVDNGSASPDRQRLTARIGGRASVLTLPDNRGYAAAANAAMRWAREYGADYLWLLNNDLTFAAGVMPRLLEALASDPEAAAAVPVSLSPASGHSVLSAGVDVNLWLGSVKHRLVGESPSRLPAGIQTVDAVEGSAMLIRLTAAERIGPLDERFFMYWEDTEWSVRARRAGFRLLVVPDARVYHNEGASSMPIDRLAAILANRVRFMFLSASRVQQIVFSAYFFGAWLPAYSLLRLVPRYGVTSTLRCLKRVVDVAGHVREPKAE